MFTAAPHVEIISVDWSDTAVDRHGRLAIVSRLYMFICIQMYENYLKSFVLSQMDIVYNTRIIATFSIIQWHIHSIYIIAIRYIYDFGICGKPSTKDTPSTILHYFTIRRCTEQEKVLRVTNNFMT